MNVPAPSAPPPQAGELGQSDAGAVAERLGFAPEQIVQEFGWDDDVDEELRRVVESAIGAELEDEDYTGETDVALMWWRAEDGDVTDALVDMVGVLEEGGFVVLLTPRGEGAVDPSVVDEAAGTAGLHSAGTVNAGESWRATKLVAPKSRR